MKEKFKKFSFPFITPILVISTLVLFSFLLIPLIFAPDGIVHNRDLLRLSLFLTTLLSAIGFIYCSVGYHFKLLRGDELKLRIHFESLNVAFTSTLVSFFILIFIGVNYWPKMLNWILGILVVIGIVVYLLASIFIKEKYQ